MAAQAHTAAGEAALPAPVKTEAVGGAGSAQQADGAELAALFAPAGRCVDGARFGAQVQDHLRQRHGGLPVHRGMVQLGVKRHPRLAVGPGLDAGEHVECVMSSSHIKCGHLARVVKLESWPQWLPPATERHHSFPRSSSIGVALHAYHSMCNIGHWYTCVLLLHSFLKKGASRGLSNAAEIALIRASRQKLWH